MTDAPSVLSAQQLKDIHIKTDIPKKKKSS